MNTKKFLCKYFFSFAFFSFLLKTCCNEYEAPIIKCGHIDQSIRITTQTEMDSFKKSLPSGCNCFLGTLRLSGDEDVDYKQLDFLKCVGGIDISSSKKSHVWRGFNKLDTVYGDLIFLNVSMTSYDAFNSLNFVGSTLQIGSENLKILDGFNELEYTKNLAINNNRDLLEIIGFKKLNKIDQTLQIWDNKSLSKIDRFDKLLNVYGMILINNNDLLTSISGFSSLEKLGNLSIVDNDKLSHIDLPLKINEMASFLLENNASLKKISGFNDLIELYFGGIYLNNNKNLSEIDAFKKLERCNNKIIIKNNASLEKCCSFYLPLKNANQETVIEIIDNGMNCNTIDQILNYGKCIKD